MKLPTVLLSAILALTASASTPYSVTEARATRAFEGCEWANASALYQLMLSESPDSAGVYPRAIVASAMMSDTAMTVDLLDRAMAHGVGIDSVLGGVRATAFAIGHADIYPDYLKRLQSAKPYMRRAIDTRLLDYYIFRRDPQKIVEYAQLMLRGLPDNTQYLSDLGYGQMLGNDFEGATATWEKILSTDPDHYDTLLLLGNHYINTGQREKGLPYLERAYALRPTPYVASLLKGQEGSAPR